ncbi:hypothetical protein GGR54DRAFT_585549 [Hypoxylon sp. NC1633]|nr:hypothetical protein GGR54DRAFT_585549 [Hypoxylon sp. NC1633]
MTCEPLLYFSKADNGSILNRFSQDLELVNKRLPPDVQTIGVQIFKLSVEAILLFIAHRLLTLTLPVCFLVVYLV